MVLFLKNIIKNFDVVLWVSFFSFSLISLFTLYNTNGDNLFFKKQIIWVFLSAVIMFFFSKIDFTFLNKTKYVLYIYALSGILLLSTLVFGKYISGSRGWLDFGVFSLQPADFAKISIIIILSKYFAKRHMEIENIKHIIVSLFYIGIVVFVILMQPDLGSALVILSIWFGIIFFSGISKKHLMAFVSIGVIVLTFAWFFIFKEYQKNRILNFIDPTRDRANSGYNVYQSQIAVGSGGLLGKGITNGTQSEYHYLPESETDFIFAAFAEEWGFLGVILYFFLFTVFIFRLLYFSYHAKNTFSSFMTIGFVFWITVHFIVNVGMNIGLLPVTGIPLPFMSYGGSHLISESIMLGIVMSLNKNHKPNSKRYYKNEFVGLE